MRTVIKALCISAVFGISLQAYASDYHADRTHLVDQNSQLGTYLFRGNMPLTGDKDQRAFIYEQLSKQITDSVTPKLANGFYLIDLTLINRISPDEHRDLNIETRFFENHSDKGALAHHAITGQLVSYPELLKKLGRFNTDKQLSNIKLPVFIDKFPTLVAQMGDCIKQKKCDELAPLYNNPDNLPVVVYFHCEAGTDRTGSLAASYRFKFKAMTLNQAWQMNLKEISRAPYKVSKREAENYCARLTPLSDWTTKCIVND